MSQDLIQAINHKMRELDFSLTEFKNDGQAKAETEYQYRVALTAKMAELRDMGEKATTLRDFARGDKEVALLAKKRDIALTMYEASQSALQNCKLQLRILDAQIAREWGR